MLDFSKGGYGHVFLEILRNPNIEPEAKSIYAYLCGFAGNGDTCYPSRKTMLYEMGMSETRFSKYMNQLKAMGVVEVIKTKRGNLRAHNIYRINHKICITENDGFTDLRCSENWSATKGSATEGSATNLSTKINSIKNNSLNNNNNKESICNSAESPPHKTKKFVKPTVEEVKAYCEERGNNIDPEHFVDYYESNGWMVGKNKMKDWHAAIRTWERRDKNNKEDSTDSHTYNNVVAPDDPDVLAMKQYEYHYDEYTYKDDPDAPFK